MSALVSPLEALAFDYFRFGFFTVVNNLWTWVALLTAAFSFWRIRAAGSGGTISISVKSEAISSSNCVNQPQPVREISLPEPQTSTAPASPPPSRPSILEDDGVTKGKFTVYYQDDTEKDSECHSDDELTVVGEWGHMGMDAESFESLLRKRIGNRVWYRYQDLTAINGNVVRLWDGGRRI